MKNKKAFYLTNILFKISIVLILINIGFVHINRQNEKREMKEAKIIIYDTFKTYSTKALGKHKEYIVHLDYGTREISVKTTTKKIIEKIPLPKKLYYVTVFRTENSTERKRSEFEAKITNNGNITPSFSIYIFDYKKIARYRISCYGFQTIKFMKINIYKNSKDKTATYKNIVRYHDKLRNNNDHFLKYWRKE